MNILGIETSSKLASVALLEDERVIREETLGTETRHSQDLVPCVGRVLGPQKDAVDLVAIGSGPGSYTGLRIGATFAKMFCTQTDTPVVAVSSLDVIAGNVREFDRLCVVVDARLRQVYAALYESGRGKVKGDLVARPQEVAAELEPGTQVLGDALRRYREVFAGAGELIEDEALWRPRASHAARLGRRRFIEEGGEDPAALAPRYLRRPQAEIKWEQSQNASGPR
ncbi:MAG: tRNA (adenosine(37)-N6)-threonylcarbamoyltransferase complex dimerization subunit type 1 TsaB [Planctomycetota bacterium]